MSSRKEVCTSSSDWSPNESSSGESSESSWNSSDSSPPAKKLKQIPSNASPPARKQKKIPRRGGKAPRSRQGQKGQKGLLQRPKPAAESKKSLPAQQETPEECDTGPLGLAGQEQERPVTRSPKGKQKTKVRKEARSLLRVQRTALEESCIIGTDDLKLAAWTKFLGEATEMVKNAEELTPKARIRAEKTIRSLKNRETATAAGAVALKNFEYFNEDRIRTVISVAFEEAMPGEWSCGWSSERVKKISQILTVCISRITRTVSKVLRGLPIFVVGAFLHVIFTCEHGESVKSWGLDVFRDTVWKCVDTAVCASYPEHERTRVNLTIVKLGIDLMAILCKKVAPLFKGRDISYAEDVIREVQETVGSSHPTTLEWTNAEIEDIMNCLSVVSPSLYTELLPQIWIAYEKKPEKFALDTLVFDILYLLRDLYYPVRVWQTERWNKELQDLMFEIGGDQDETGFFNLDFVKIFLLVSVLQGTGLMVEKVDTTFIATQLVGRITTKGLFTEKRVREHIPLKYRRRLAKVRKAKTKPAQTKIGRFAAS